MKRIGKFNKLIIENWSWITLLFIFSFFIYQILKTFVLDPSSGKQQNIIEFNLISFSGLVCGTILLILISLYRARLGAFQLFLFSSLSYLLLSASYIYVKHPDLEWTGLDVPLYNYEIACEIKEYGIPYIYRTWNQRANPFDTISVGQTDYILEIKNNARIRMQNWNNISKIKIWRNVENLGVNINNNRPYMHPPLASLLMGIWLKIVPLGRLSIQIFVVLITLVSFSFMIFPWISNINKNILVPVLVSVISIPVLIINSEPSADQFCMLFIGISIILLLKRNHHYWVFPFLAGIMAGMAFFTKFIVGFYIFLQLIGMIVLIRKGGIPVLVGYCSGLILVFLIFTLSGYYFWLTYLTGKAYAVVYAQYHPTSLFNGIFKLLYFGPSFILFVIILIFNKSIRDLTVSSKAVLYALAGSIMLTILYLGNTPVYNRYLSIYLIGIVPFIFLTNQNLILKNRDYITIPFSNFLFLLLIIYF